MGGRWFVDVQEKQPYMSKAVQKKSEYDKSLSAYKSKQVHGVERCGRVSSD